MGLPLQLRVVPVQQGGVQLQLDAVQGLDPGTLAVQPPQILALGLEGMVQQGQQHIARQHRQLMVEAENPLRGFVRIPGFPDGLQQGGKAFHLLIAAFLQHQLQAQQLQRLPHLQQSLHLAPAQGAAVIAHDGHQGLHGAPAAIVADIDPLTGFDLHEAQLLQLHQPGRDHRSGDPHPQAQLPGRRQLLPYRQLAGEDHILDLLHEQIRQGKGLDPGKAHGSNLLNASGITSNLSRLIYQQFALLSRMALPKTLIFRPLHVK